MTKLKVFKGVTGQKACKTDKQSCEYLFDIFSTKFPFKAAFLGTVHLQVDGEKLDDSRLPRLVQELRTKIFATGALAKMNRGEPKDEKDSTGRYYLLRDEEETRYGIYDRPLPCFGCGTGWFCFLTGFLCPVMWYYATILYFGNYYRKDPRERSGLAASAVAALACTVAAFITILVIFL